MRPTPHPIASLRRVEMRLPERLTATSLAQSIAGILPELDPGEPVLLVVDALDIASYTAEAREDFVEFARRHTNSIERFAILTDRSLWRVVISAMSLASGMSMHAYPSRVELNRALDRSAS